MPQNSGAPPNPLSPGMERAGAVSPWLMSVHLWGGLGLAVLFTAYDTQNIIEEYRAGSRDFLRHSFDMFINFMMIFRRMLALLMMNRD